jgi:H+-translocating NAD(P) transhydrogenase subunit beta
LVAFAKLQELLSGNAIAFPGIKIVNAVLFAICILCIISMTASGGSVSTIVILAVTACLLGVLLVLPIGGADMPVVIALLNSYSGIAASAAGFITGNSVLIIAGSLVGASGLILTKIMCDGMNRSLFNVLFGVMGDASGEAVDADEIYAGKIKKTSADELAMILETASRVVIVPGYGLAMAQAQHAVRELASAIEANGAEVEYAIHPVAGRMPGHMNVLLAEAEVSYDKLVDMDTINPTFQQTDVAIVIGANDVTNPMAREDKGSPIYGMPILDVDKATTVVVLKRSLSPGFAGLPNPLFAKDNTLMLFGDGKQAVLDITSALKEL